MLMIPESLQWLQHDESGQSWLAELPYLIEECAERWDLRLGEPYSDSYVSLVVPATRQDGTAAVLKIQFPHRESEHEAQALAVWDGNAAVQLLDHDPKRKALLIEHCQPGTHLSKSSASHALDVFLDLLPRLWRPVGEPFRSLADEAATWREELPRNWQQAEKPYERRLVDAVIDMLGDLDGVQGEQVLLHQDLHADNVLAAQREPWLVIDPKPLRGEREFSVAPIVRAYELGHSRDAVINRLTFLTSELGLDWERARMWSIAQTVAWSLDGTQVLPLHVETARWLLSM